MQALADIMRMDEAAQHAMRERARTAVKDTFSTATFQRRFVQLLRTVL